MSFIVFNIIKGSTRRRNCLPAAVPILARWVVCWCSDLYSPTRIMVYSDAGHKATPVTGTRAKYARAVAKLPKWPEIARNCQRDRREIASGCCAACVLLSAARRIYYTFGGTSIMCKRFPFDAPATGARGCEWGTAPGGTLNARKRCALFLPRRSRLRVELARCSTASLGPTF